MYIYIPLFRVLTCQLQLKAFYILPKMMENYMKKGCFPNKLSFLSKVLSQLLLIFWLIFRKVLAWCCSCETLASK